MYRIMGEEKLRDSDNVPPPVAPELLDRQSSVVSLGPPLLSSYQSTPITKHYDLNNQILSAFEVHYESKLYRVAYAIGLRFVETALLEIPKHGYFYSERHRDELMVNSLEAIRVTNLLQEIQQQDPDLRKGVDQVRLQKLQHLALEQASVQQQQDEDADVDETKQGEPAHNNKNKIKKKASLRERSSLYEKQRAAIEAELGGLTANKSSAVTRSSNKYAGSRGRHGEVMSGSQELDKLIGPILSCGDSMSALMCPQGFSSRKVSEEDFVIIDETKTGPPKLSSFNNTATTTESDSNNDASFPKHNDKQQKKNLRKKQGNGAIDFENTALRVDHHDPLGALDDSESNHSNNKLHESSAQNVRPHLIDGSSIGPTKFLQREPTRESMVLGSFDEQLQKALYLSGLEVADAAAEEAVAAADYTTDGTVIGSTQLTNNVYKDFEDIDDQFRPTKPPRPSLEKKQLPPRQQQQQLLPPKLQQQGRYNTVDPPALLSEQELYPPKRQMSVIESAIQTIQGIYHEDFDSYREMGHIRVSHINTYQGKIEGSTNGCTVIAPLLCIHHFMNTVDFSQDSIRSNSSSSSFLDPGLPDATIVQVMEEETPAILPKIRNELGLMPNAFLIPSDAHDYLIKSQLLSQEQFVTVCGGNILNEDHLSAFVDQLEKTYQQEDTATTTKTVTVGGDSTRGPPSSSRQHPEHRQSSSSTLNSQTSQSQQSDRQQYKKLAATLFFHEHVIAILKLQRSPGCYWYDIIDSLPSAVTLMTRAEEEKLLQEEKQKQQEQEELLLQQQQQYQQHQQHQQSWDNINSATSNPLENTSISENQYHQESVSDDTVPSTQLIAATSSEAIAMAAAAEAQAIADEESAAQFLMMNDDGTDPDEVPINTARIRCLNETALTAALRWYACSKFDRQNLNYIDMYPWDENNCDFDPRVFQAFVWTEA